MTTQERFVRTLTGKPVDRVPYCLFWGPWSRAWQRWEREGKPADVTDHRSFVQPDHPPASIPVNCGPCPPVERQVLEETEDYRVHTDHWGIVRRDYKHGESMPAFLEFPIANCDDWREYKAERFDPHDPARLAGEWSARSRGRSSINCIRASSRVRVALEPAHGCQSWMCR